MKQEHDSIFLCGKENKMAEIVLRSGKIVYGKLVRKYTAFEGGIRYIFHVDGYGDVRCVYENAQSNYREYVA